MDLKQLVILTLQISVVGTVFGFGLKTTLADLLYLLRQPGLLVRSVIAVFVIMPIVAVAISQWFDFPRTVLIALIALSISPTPPLLPSREAKSGGHESYGLGLMALLAALSIVVVPLSAQLLSVFFGHTLGAPASRIAGIVFISVAAAAYLYGTVQQPINTPSWLRGSLQFLGMNFGVYRLFLVIIALAVTVILVLALEATRFGAQVRAAVDNQRMARGLGIDVDRVFAVTFALGGGLAGLGGALAIEIVGLDPAFAFTYLVYVLIVVAVGGLGSIGGSFVAAAVIGISDMAGKYYFPQLGAFVIYLVMVALLIWRPAGLFGKRQA